MQTALRLIVVVVLSLFVLAAGLMLMRNQMIYVFAPQDAPPGQMPRTRVAVLPAFGEDPALTVWVTEPLPGQPVVLYFMGNSGSLSLHEPRLRELARAGFGIAAMAYRGAGDQPGQPGQRALMRDATRVYAALDRLIGQEVEDGDRVIWGYSLGSALAAQLAAEQEELAVVLEASFPRLCDLARHHYPWLPGCFALRGEEYDTAAVIASIGAPLLVLHGDQDDIVPVAMGQAVFDAAADPKFLIRLPEGNHENLPRLGGMQEGIGYIRTLRGAR